LSIFAEKEEMLAHAVNIADFYWWTAIHQWYDKPRIQYFRQNQSTTGKLKTVMTLTWYRHF
jgi:hypothetical protein